MAAQPTEKQARHFVAGLQVLLADCKAFKDHDGSAYTLSQANYGSFGVETFAVPTTVSTELMSLMADLVVIRKVNLLSLIRGAAVPATRTTCRR